MPRSLLLARRVLARRVLARRVLARRVLARRRELLLPAVAGAAACAVLAALSGCATPAGAPAAIPAATQQRLLTIAEQAAQSSGDKNPEWITVVATTHAKALTSATPGDYTGNANEAVYLITIKGQFTAYNASYPAGAKAPTGRYLSIVLDAKTLQGTDSGLSPNPPPVPPSALGPVTYLRGS